ncbi:hypothetical protein O3P69_006042 [Scylla paramamosain]|uniref:Uncharacterized protein n=1 Tax=Scylla paramamosain TaxID=85552 RepID=A0AAW0U669_SCYPA
MRLIPPKKFEVELVNRTGQHTRNVQSSQVDEMCCGVRSRQWKKQFHTLDSEIRVKSCAYVCWITKHHNSKLPDVEVCTTGMNMSTFTSTIHLTVMLHELDQFDMSTRTIMRVGGMHKASTKILHGFITNDKAGSAVSEVH